MGPCQHRWPSEALMLTRAAARSHPDLQRPRRRGLSIAAGSWQILTHRVVRAKATNWEPHSVGEASKGVTGPFPHCSDAFGIGHRRLYMYNTLAASRSPTPCALRRARPRPDQSPISPLAAGVVYVGTESGRFYALDRQTGDELWVLDPTAGMGMLESPSVSDGILYVESSEGYLLSLDAGTGELIWGFQKGFFSGVRTYTVVEGVVYVNSLGGAIYAISAPEPAVR